MDYACDLNFDACTSFHESRNEPRLDVICTRNSFNADSVVKIPRRERIDREYALRFPDVDPPSAFCVEVLRGRLNKSLDLAHTGERPDSQTATDITDFVSSQRNATRRLTRFSWFAQKTIRD